MALTKNDKDATRQERKAKKRKLEDAIPDVPGDYDIPDVVHGEEKSAKKRKRTEEGAVNAGSDEKSEKKRLKEERKKSKEERAGAVASVAVAQVSAQAEAAGNVEEEAPRKSKKERKAERKAKEAAAAAEIPHAAAKPIETAVLNTEIAGSTTQTGGGAAPAPATEKSKKNNRNREKKRKGANGVALGGEDGAAKESKAARFIVFIGNLPFSATKESVEKHFASVKPKSVRCLTQKDNPTKSKGCAFVEFDGYDHMKTCLKLLHHSNFDDGISAPRKINVELSAGGGGNTKARKDKIGEKNQKLNEERARRMMEEEKAKLVKKDGAIDNNSIHPSRWAHVPST